MDSNHRSPVGDISFFDPDSPLERAGFELRVPRGRGFGFCPVRNQRLNPSRSSGESVRTRVSGATQAPLPLLNHLRAASRRCRPPSSGLTVCWSAPPSWQHSPALCWPHRPWRPGGSRRRCLIVLAPNGSRARTFRGWLAMSRWLMPSGLQFCMRDSIASVNRNSIFAKRNVPAAYRMCCSAMCGRTLSARASAIAAHAASLRVAVSARQCGGSKLVSFQTFGPGDISTAIASRTVGDKR